MGKRKNCGNRECDCYTYCEEYYEDCKPRKSCKPCKKPDPCKNKKCKGDCCVKDPCWNPCWGPGQWMPGQPWVQGQPTVVPGPVPKNECCSMYRAITVNGKDNDDSVRFGEPNRDPAPCSKGRWVHGCDCTDTSRDRKGIAFLMPDYDDDDNLTGTLCGMLLYDESCKLVKKPIFGIIGNDCFDKDTTFVGKRPINSGGIYYVTYRHDQFRILATGDVPGPEFAGSRYNRSDLIKKIYVTGGNLLPNVRKIIKTCGDDVDVLPPMSANNTNCMVTFTSMYTLYLFDCYGRVDRFRDDCEKSTYGLSNKCGDKHFVANGDAICTKIDPATNVDVQMSGEVVNAPIGLFPGVKPLKFFKNCGFVKYQYFSLACLDCCDKDDIHVTYIECADGCEPSLIGQKNIRQVRPIRDAKDTKDNKNIDPMDLITHFKAPCNNALDVIFICIVRFLKGVDISTQNASTGM